MTELSGSLEGVGLPVVIRFLTRLEKTGVLRIAYHDLEGELVLEAGRLTSVSFGTRQGLAALDGLVQALPAGSFSFDTGARARGAPNIDLSPDGLETHLEGLLARIASGKPSLPSVDAVPELVSQDESGAGEETLPLDRGLLLTLLAVDGRRTVREILADRGSIDALWQFGDLAEVGLVRLASAGSAALLPAEPTSVQPKQATPHCPMLGFEDDPATSSGRPTRLHRCFAAGTPLPLSLDHQQQLCLSDQFGTCPRLGTTERPINDLIVAQSAMPAEPDAVDPRIVRLPLAARIYAAQRSSEPTQLHAAGTSHRNGDSPRPTPLRARIERASGARSAVSVVEPTYEQRSTPPEAVRALPRTPSPPRLGGGPIWLIVGAAVVLTVLVLVVVYLLKPNQPSVTTASVVAASAPVAAIAAPTVLSEAVPATVAATSIPTPAPTAQPPATLLDEHFINNDRKWPSSPQGTAWLTSGSYRLIPRQPTQFVAIGTPLTDRLRDVIVSATFRKLGGTPPGGGFGIIVRDQGPGPRDGIRQDGQYYVLEVGDKGEVGIWRRDTDHWVDLLAWQHSDAVHLGTATNALMVSAIGNRLSLSVNGTQVVSRTDETLSSGTVGMLVGGDGDQVAVDHLLVQTP
jgi:hypothetical protein